MDKEEEILQRLEQLRVDQLKALKELKKVEKAKKKQRRLTAHGHPVITKSRTKNNDTTTEKRLSTPAHSKKHVLYTCSKTCGNFDRRQVKTTSPNVKKVHRAEKATNSALSSNENAFSINDPVERNRTDVKQLKPCMAEAYRREEGTYKAVSKPHESLDLTPKTSLLSHKEEHDLLASVVKRKGLRRLAGSPRFSKKIRSSLGFPPASERLLKSDSSIWNSVSDKQVCSPNVRKPEYIVETATGKIAELHSDGHQIENDIWPKPGAGDRQDFCHDIMPNNMLHCRINSSRAESEEQTPSRHDTSLLGEDRSEKLLPLDPAVFPENEQFSQSIFSQSLFGDVSVGDSIPCEEETLKKPGKEDVSYCYEPLVDRNVSNEADACKSEVINRSSKQRQDCNERKERKVNVEKINERSKGRTSEMAATSILPSSGFQLGREVCMEPSDSPFRCGLFGNWNEKENRRGDKNRNSVTEQACNVEKESQINDLEKKETIADFETNSTTSLHLDNGAYKHISCKTDVPSHTSTSFSLKFEEEISSKREEESRNANFSKRAELPEVLGEVSLNLSSAILREMPMEENVNETNLSTVMKGDSVFQQDISDVSSLRKMFQAGFGQVETRNNPASLIQKFDSRYEFEDTKGPLVMQESKCFQLIEDYITNDKIVVSGHKSTERKDKIEGLPCETSMEMSTDVPHCIQFSNKQTVNDRSEFKTESDAEAKKNKVNREENTVPQELDQLGLIEDRIRDYNFDDLFLSEPLTSSVTPFPQNIPAREENSRERVASTSIVREICLQHSTDSSPRSNEVRAIKFLSYHVGETTLDVISVCLPRLLVLWKALDSCTWVVLHKWVLDKDEEIVDLEVTSAGPWIVLIAGGKFAKALGRMYCVYDSGDRKFDIYDEFSFSGLGETAYVYKDICLLPCKVPIENIQIILASAYEGKISLTKWKIDLMCLCLEDCKDLPDVFGNKLSSLCLVQGSNCLLLGCVDSYIYLWSFNSCELLCKMDLDLSLFTTPICLNAETSMGMIFLSLLYKEECKICLVAINPQTSREASLKTLNMAHAIGDQRNKILHCCMAGANVISSFHQGQILVWNIATDSKTILDLEYVEAQKVCSISVHPEEPVIAFGTISGCVYLNVMQ